MKLYPIPGGGWEGTEAAWKAAMKAAGFNPKDFEATKTREVPTGKKELMEFLTFFTVDVYRTGTTVPKTVDVDALRAEHNPGAAPLPPGHGDAPDDHPAAIARQSIADLPAAFAAAPLKVQAELAVGLIDRLTA